MMKNKGNTALPDNRLAKVFNFTSKDLAANRLGFITSAQQFNAPHWQRKLFGTLGKYIRLGQDRKKVAIGKCCGRIEKIHETYQIHNAIRGAVLINEYKLKIQDRDFTLSQTQFHAISQHTLYNVYFDTDNDRIVAMERVENDC